MKWGEIVTGDMLIRVDVTPSALTTTVTRKDGTVVDTSVTRQR